MSPLILETPNILFMEAFFMKNKKKEDVIPLYSTLPLVQPEKKTDDAKVSIPSDENVVRTRDWSKELKL